MKSYSKNSSKKRLVIGFVLDDRLDKPDGVQQYITTLGNWLSTQGHEVHYLVGNSPSMRDRKDVHHLGRTVEVRFNKNKVGIPLPAKKSIIKKILENYNFDVLHVQVPYSPQLAAKVINAAKPNTAIIGTFHILPYAKKEQAGTRLLAAALTRSRKKFDHMFSVSSEAAIFAEKFFKTDSSVLPNVVDTVKFAVAKPERAKRKKIVFLGRLVPRKGAGELMDAYKKLLDMHPDLETETELIIGGKGAQLLELETKARTLRNQFKKSKVTFAGFIAEEDKSQFLANADIAVFPATGGESFGIVLLEGMAAGSGVVLAGNNPGYKSVLGSMPECMVEPTDSLSFANSLYKLLSDNKLSERLHAEQREYVKNFDVAYIGKKLTEHYYALANKKQTKHNSNNA